MPLFNMKRRTLRPFDAIFVLFTLGAIGLEGTAYRNGDLSSRAEKAAQQNHLIADPALANPCTARPCFNGATCIKLNGGAFDCVCTARFTGPVCKKERDPCDSSPCRNGGTCTKVRYDVFKCTCAKGFTGNSCAQDVDECKHKNGGCQDICVNTLGGYRCACSDPGFRIARDKHHCVELDPCDSSPCRNGGTCTKVRYDAFRCTCDKGFTGNSCAQVERNPCDSSPCRNGGTCSKLEADVFKCTCATGFTGQKCANDVDECKHYNGGCQDICVNTLGGYYCACSDPEFSVAPDKRHCIAEGVNLDCGQNEMTITLPKSLLLGLDREHLRLIDVKCKASENVTHLFLRTALTGCKTILRHKGDYAVYENVVSEIPIKQNQVVTRVRNAMIPFYCFYSKWGVVSSIGIKPSSKKVILSSKGSGKFTITLDLFKKYDFKNPYSQEDFPVQFTIRQHMFFEVRVDTEDNRLTILALDCYATPSQDRNSQPRYNVIKDGCAVDKTLKFLRSPNPQSQRFSLEAFQYVSKHPHVFFHCKVKICSASDPNSRCAHGCAEQRRQIMKALPGNANDVYSLAQGPLTLNREKREAETEVVHESDQSMRLTESSTNLPVVAALAVIIGVCAVGISYMAWQKKRRKTARQYKPLYVNQPNRFGKL